MAALLLSLGLVALLLAAAWCDVAARVIPNRISLAVAAVAVSLRLLGGPAALGLSIAGAVALFACLAILHARGVMGGGDVKLASALALALSPLQTLQFLEFTAFAGGVLAILYLLGRRLPLRAASAPARGTPLLRRVWRAELRRLRLRAPLPYGVALAAGGAFVLLGN